ncbi:hypothetical protein EN852_039745, partial [Mesorhizobium sp. M2E.F.Ca.ET.209.01.1.1]
MNFETAEPGSAISIPSPDELNLFKALFSFRVRDGHSPKENFLTEALVYTLKKNPVAMREWVK